MEDLNNFLHKTLIEKNNESLSLFETIELAELYEKINPSYSLQLLLNAIDIFLQFDITNIDDILNFIEHLYKCSTAKNNTQEYFLNRGYNINDTKIELHKVFDTWKKFNSNVDKSSEKYKLWLESRKPGLKATRSSLRSKFEKKIYEALKSDFKINLKFYTKVNNVNFSKSIFIPFSEINIFNFSKSGEPQYGTFLTSCLS